ncbi:MAG: alpha-amylase family glycosyl hydrolase, partial [Lachnospiraceae bacterium]
MSIDSQYGSMEDFEKLLADCHERNIRLIMDLPLNHTSVEHAWFRAASDYLHQLPPDWEPSSDYCPYFDYYHFTRQAQDGYAALEGTNWYYEARFWEGMPDLNLDSGLVRREIGEILKFWLDKGVDGFRLDAVTSFYTGNHQANIDFLSWLKDTARAVDPDVYFVGECWDDQTVYTDYYRSGMNSFFDFAFAGREGMIAEVVRGNKKAEAYTDALVYEEDLFAQAE